jgi:hypothetical protein
MVRNSSDGMKHQEEQEKRERKISKVDQSRGRLSAYGL